MSLEELQAVRAQQVAMTRRVLAGEALHRVAPDFAVGARRVATIVHMVCQHQNPDLYCDELKACLKRNHFCWDVKPSLRFLRSHAAAFGFPVSPEELGA